MSLGTFNRCCFVIDLRSACFIIAYLLLGSRIIQFILSCCHLAGVNYALNYTSHHHVLMYQDLTIFKLILSFEILLLIFEILITVALINGLYKKIQDQVQMFYAGGFALEVLRLIIFSLLLLRYAHIMGKTYGTWQWTIFTFEIILHFLYIYFLFTVRSYYFMMKKEEDAKRWNVFSNTVVQLKIDK